MAKSSRLPPARAEHIGSFLRPAELHAEIERVYARSILRCSPKNAPKI